MFFFSFHPYCFCNLPLYSSWFYHARIIICKLRHIFCMIQVLKQRRIHKSLVRFILIKRIKRFYDCICHRICKCICIVYITKILSRFKIHIHISKVTTLLSIIIIGTKIVCIFLFVIFHSIIMRFKFLYTIVQTLNIFFKPFLLFFIFTIF